MQPLSDDGAPRVDTIAPGRYSIASARSAMRMGIKIAGNGVPPWSPLDNVTDNP